MRAYFFGNMYLSSIQQGIQAAHVVHELFIKYPENLDAGWYLHDWAKNHKTMVLLNAGYADEIRDLIKTFKAKQNPYPWCEFHEEQASLDGALTSVGIILPPKIYEGSKLLREGGLNPDDVMDTGLIPIEDTVQRINSWEFGLLERLNDYGLAR